MASRFVPTGTLYSLTSWFVITLLMSAVGLFALNFTTFMQVLDSKDLPASQEYAASSAQVLDAAVSSINSLPHGSEVAVFLLWTLAGMAVYLLLVCLAGMWSAARNDAAIMHYRLPAFAQKVSLLQTILVHWALLFIMAFLAVVFAGLLLFVCLPFCRELFAFGIYGTFTLSAILQLVSASLLMSVSLMIEGFLLFITKRLFAEL